MMKSSLIAGPKIEELAFLPEQLTLTVNKSEVDQFIAEEFARVAKQHGQISQLEAGVAIGDGDIVEATFASVLEKFNKTVPLALGRGFFDKEVEAAMVGMAVGEEKTFTIQEEAVTITILSAKRKLIPEVTGAMLAEEFGEFYPDAQTVAEFEEHFFQDRLEDYKYDQYFNGAAGYISDVLLKSIEVASDEAEYQAFKEEIWESLKLEAKEMESEFEPYLHTVFTHDDQPVEDIYQVVEETIKRDFVFYVYAYHTLKDEVTPPTEADYEAELAGWAAEGDKTVEELKAMMPYSGAIKRAYIEEAQNRILNKFYTELDLEVV